MEINTRLTEEELKESLSMALMSISLSREFFLRQENHAHRREDYELTIKAMEKAKFNIQFLAKEIGIELYDVKCE